MSAGSKLKISLPHSKQSPYKGNVWPILTKDLEKLRSSPSANLLEATILKYLNRNLDARQRVQSLQNLRAVFSQQPEGGAQIIAYIAESALKLPQLFPDGSLPGLVRGTPGLVELSRGEVCCLLAHMLLCSLLVQEELRPEYCGHFTGAQAPTGPLTFCYWLYHQSNATNIYLRTLLTYFTHHQTLSQGELEEKVTFQRFVCAETEKSWDPTTESAGSQMIAEVGLHLDGRIGDLEQVEVDFANKHVGFGTTATQEELLLGTSPESCVVVLFNEVLEAEESLLITGARRFGDYSGYGRAARYTGTFSPSWNWRERKILAIDALSHPSDQLGDVTMRRELRKAWRGFSSVRGSRLSTGHWGCGAFGGDQSIKCLLQVIAASLAGVKLDFYCFGDKTFHAAFQSALRVMEGKSVEWVWSRIVQYRAVKVKGGRSVLNYISSELGVVQE